MRTATDELAQAIDSGEPPSLAVVFASPYFQSQLPQLASLVGRNLRTSNVLGGSWEPLHDSHRVIADAPCVSLWVAWWPDAFVQLQHMSYDRRDASFSPQFDEVNNRNNTTLLMLAEPCSFPADVLLSRWVDESLGIPVAGGLCSSVNSGEPLLVMGENSFADGAVVAAITGVPTTSFVSQGCRPIGEPFVITKAERNEIFELGGKRASDQLQAVFDRLPTRDKDLLERGIHLGRVVNEYQDTFETGDFLIRNVTGVDQEEGSISVADYHQVGQTVQFHLRDAETASQDFETLLLRHTSDAAYQGALLFAGGGRARLFEDSHQDLKQLRRVLGAIPTAGCFCDGEIGAVGSKSFLHTYAASAVLFK